MLHVCCAMQFCKSNYFAAYLQTTVNFWVEGLGFCIGGVVEEVVQDFIFTWILRILQMQNIIRLCCRGHWDGELHLHCLIISERAVTNKNVQQTGSHVILSSISMRRFPFCRQFDSMDCGATGGIIFYQDCYFLIRTFQCPPLSWPMWRIIFLAWSVARWYLIVSSDFQRRSANPLRVTVESAIIASMMACAVFPIFFRVIFGLPSGWIFWGKFLGSGWIFWENFSSVDCRWSTRARYPYHSEPMSIRRSLWMTI